MLEMLPIRNCFVYVFCVSKQYHKHLFVHLGPNVNFQDSILEAVDIRQIYDKFPDKKGGLRELYEKGPQSVFFLVKFWVSRAKGIISKHFRPLQNNCFRLLGRSKHQREG